MKSSQMKQWKQTPLLEMGYGKCSSMEQQEWGQKENHYRNRNSLYTATKLPYTYSLIERCSNNVVEYNALIIRLQIAKNMGFKYLENGGDSKLIVNQVKGKYGVKNEKLVPYHQATIAQTEKFTGFYIDYIPQKHNTHANALASLASTQYYHLAEKSQWVAKTCIIQNKYQKSIRMLLRSFNQHGI